MIVLVMNTLQILFFYFCVTKYYFVKSNYCCLQEVQTSEDMTSTQEDEKVLEKLIASSDITETESAKLLAQHKQRMKEQQGVFLFFFLLF